MLDDEAEEEEEEEAVRGLGDFGFTNTLPDAKDKDGDVSAGELDEDDMEAIVDELSDNEGDQEAAEEARRRNDAQAEEDSLREVIRQAREGFDGRRGGGGAGGARGNFRMDQLIGLDKNQLKEQKRLGLAENDEFGGDGKSGDEKGDESDKEKEIDDEEALAEAIKARHMGPQRLATQEYSSSEDEQEEIATQGECRVSSDPEMVCSSPTLSATRPRR